MSYFTLIQEYFAAKETQDLEQEHWIFANILLTYLIELRQNSGLPSQTRSELPGVLLSICMDSNININRERALELLNSIENEFNKSSAELLSGIETTLLKHVENRSEGNEAEFSDLLDNLEIIPEFTNVKFSDLIDNFYNDISDFIRSIYFKEFPKNISQKTCSFMVTQGPLEELKNGTWTQERLEYYIQQGANITKLIDFASIAELDNVCDILITKLSSEELGSILITLLKDSLTNKNEKKEAQATFILKLIEKYLPNFNIPGSEANQILFYLIEDYITDDILLGKRISKKIVLKKLTEIKTLIKIGANLKEFEPSIINECLFIIATEENDLTLFKVMLTANLELVFLISNFFSHYPNFLQERAEISSLILETLHSNLSMCKKVLYDFIEGVINDKEEKKQLLEFFRSEFKLNNDELLSYIYDDERNKLYYKTHSSHSMMAHLDRFHEKKLKFILKYVQEHEPNFKPIGHRALLYFIEKNKINMVEYLIGLGVDPAAYHSEALKKAVTRVDGSSEGIIGLLIDSGANPKKDGCQLPLYAIKKVEIIRMVQEEALPSQQAGLSELRLKYLRITNFLLIKMFPDIQETIDLYFSNPEENDVTYEIIYEIINSQLTLIQQAAFKMLDLRTKLSERSAEYAGNDSLCRKANEHFETKVVPYLKAQFERTSGDTTLDKIQEIEKEIRAAILNKIIEVNQEEADEKSQQLISYIKKNKDALVLATDENVMSAMRALVISKTDNSQIAWRAYDPNAPYCGDFPNLLTRPKVDGVIFSTAASSNKALSNFEASDICRERVAFYFLALKNREINAENFFQQIADIRSAHGILPNGDAPSCFPGTITRIAKMGAGSETLQLPPTREEIIKNILNAKIISHFSRQTKNMTRAQATTFHSALVYMSMATAVSIIEGEDPDSYNENWLKLRSDFKASLPNFAPSINHALEESKELDLNDNDDLIIDIELADLGASGRSEQMYDRLPFDRAEIIKNTINAMILNHFLEKIRHLIPSEAKALYNALTINPHSPDYDGNWLQLRSEFINSFGNEEIILLKIKSVLKEKGISEIQISDDEKVIIHNALANPNAERRVEQMYNHLPFDREDEKSELIENANAIKNPYVFSNAIFKHVPAQFSSSKRIRYLSNKLKEFIEFELLSQACLPLLPKLDSEVITSFIKFIIIETKISNLERNQDKLSEAFDKSFAEHSPHFSQEMKKVLLTVKEEILEKSILNGLYKYKNAKELFKAIKEKWLQENQDDNELIQAWKDLKKQLPKLQHAESSGSNQSNIIQIPSAKSADSDQSNEIQMPLAEDPNSSLAESSNRSSIEPAPQRSYYFLIGPALLLTISFFLIIKVARLLLDLSSIESKRSLDTIFSLYGIGFAIAADYREKFKCDSLKKYENAKEITIEEKQAFNLGYDAQQGYYPWLKALTDKNAYHLSAYYAGTRAYEDQRKDLRQRINIS